LAAPLKEIAVEEMGHLISVQNLLLAIGGEAYFARESPLPANDPFPFRLQPVGLTSLAKYVTAESPLRATLAQDPALLARAERAFSVAELATSLAGGLPSPGVNHVGVLYAKLYWLFQSSDDPEGPWSNPAPGPFGSGHIADADFVNATLHQVSSDEIGSSTPGDGKAYVAPVLNRADALAALHQIAAQGEGWAADDGENSHFERFLNAFELFARYADTGAEPALPVPTDPTTAAVSTGRNCITHPAAILWAELCDARYQMLIGELWLAILLPRNDPSGLRDMLLYVSVYTDMKMGVAMIARELAKMPRSADTSERVRSAGAPFRMTPYELLPSDVGGWKSYLRERITLTAQLRTKLEATPGAMNGDGAMILDGLTGSDGDLLPLL
jgi:hypothetical protein